MDSTGTPLSPPPPAGSPARLSWVPIRSLAERHRERISLHLLSLEESDRYLRFGFPATDDQIHRYVTSLNFERDEVFGIFKAYCTRVGAGPFPTELFDETGARLRDLGHEYGAVTGRERRCGWLDMVALKYAIMIDGVTQLIMMKSDVMNDFDTIRVATAYEIGGERTDRFPYAVDAPIVPVYKEFKGWKCDLRKFRRYEDFPAEFKAYVEFIERETGVPVRIISVGPDRDETIVR